MHRLPKIKFRLGLTLALLPLLCSSCANLVGRKPNTNPRILISRSPSHSGGADSHLLPTWVKRPPHDSARLFVVGESSGADRDEALAKAWASALVRIGMTEFPELTRVGATTTERLDGSSSTRQLVLHLEQVKWAGIAEAKELGSPLTYWDEADGSYRAYRLIKWDRARIEEARQLLNRKQEHSLPLPPEMMLEEEQRIAEAVSEVQRINARIQWKDRLYHKVFRELKCGATIADLIKVLGAPDRFNPYNRVVVEKEYYWGDYRVERRGADPRVSSVWWQQNGREKRKTCF